MKKQESINVLKHMKNLITMREFEEEALEMAIEALEKIDKLDELKKNIITDWNKCELDMGAENVVEYIDNFLMEGDE